MQEAPKKKGMPTWLIVLIVVLAGGPVVLGVVSALAIYGVRKYMVNAKRAEATLALAAWSKGLVACAEKDGLPLTSPAVPESLGSVSGMKYQSVPAEWSVPAFSCAGFMQTQPQYFQYQWLQQSPAEGKLVALADLNGDGTADEHFEVRVTCSAGRCTASAPLGQ